jgi:hypothetical protein
VPAGVKPILGTTLARNAGESCRFLKRMALRDSDELPGARGQEDALTLSLRGSRETAKDKVMQTAQSSPASGLPFPRVPDVIFANWREALHGSGLSSGIQAVYSLAVAGYLEYCARNGLSVTAASARAYMGDVVRRGLAKQPQLWKDGLNWFFRAGRQHCAATRPDGVPTLGQADTGTR